MILRKIIVSLFAVLLVWPVFGENIPQQPQAKVAPATAATTRKVTRQRAEVTEL